MLKKSASALSFFLIFFSFHCYGTENNKLPPIPEPQESKTAWYSVGVGKNQVGVLAVGSEDPEESHSGGSFALTLFGRLESSPLAALLSGKQKEGDEGRLKQSLTFFGTASAIRPDEEPEASLTSLLPLESSLLARKTAATDSPKNVSPLSLVQKNGEGFLSEVTIPLPLGSALTFRKISKTQYKKQLQELSSQQDGLLDFAWFSAPSAQRVTTFESLVPVLRNCGETLDNLGKTIERQMPQIGYRDYRRILTLNHFCEKSEQLLVNAKNQDSQRKVSSLGKTLHAFLKEDGEEIPKPFTNLKDIKVFDDNTIAFLWPGTMARLIKKSLQEIKDKFEFDKNRKSRVKLELDSKSLEPKTIVQSRIELVSSRLRFVTESKPLSPARLPFFLAGQTLSENDKETIDNLCRKFDGKVGVDLSGDFHGVVETDFLRGLWDKPTKLSLARTFALRAASEKNCQEIFFLVPSAIQNDVNRVLDDLKRNELTTSYQLLLSANYFPRTLLLLPGTYRMTVLSFVSGNVLSVQQFTVAEGVDTNVLARIN